MRVLIHQHYGLLPDDSSVNTVNSFVKKNNCSIIVHFFFLKSWHGAWSFPLSSFLTIGHINIIVLFIEIITKATIFKSNLLCAKLSASYILLFHSIPQNTTLKVRWVSQSGETNVFWPAKVSTSPKPGLVPSKLMLLKCNFSIKAQRATRKFLIITQASLSKTLPPYLYLLILSFTFFTFPHSANNTLRGVVIKEPRSEHF